MANAFLKMPESCGEKMVTAGLITAAQLAVARVSQSNLGEDLGQILIKKGFLTEEKFLDFIGGELSILHVSMNEVTVDLGLIKQLPLPTARRHLAIPIRREEGKVLVAMADPLDLFALEDIRVALRSEIRPALASAQEIEMMIERHYAPQRSEGEDIEVSQYFSERSWNEPQEKLEEVATGPKVVQTVNQIIAKAYQEEASDIHIEPSFQGVRVRYRIDGLLEEKLQLSREMQLPIVSRIKIIAGLDIAERRVPQDGRVRLRLGGNPLDLRVSTFPTLYGEKVVLRLLSRGGIIGIEKLGFNSRDRKIFADVIGRSYGIFLVTGPTGSGKSTTLYAALNRLNSSEKNIISVEDPVESEIPGVNQAQVNLKAGSTFASSLRAILRQDPDVIMIGEIRDSETAEIAVRSAITGHLVLSTLHTNSAVGAISRLVDLKVEPFLIGSALIGVLAQRLVRRICPHCKEQTVADLEKLGPLKDQVHTVWRGKGCPTCRMSGYLGRLGIFELVPINDAIRRLINARASDTEIEQAVRKMGVGSITEEGIEKVNAGVTTIEEVLRVTQE